MHNLQNSDEIQSLSRQAIEGSLDGDAYASKCVELEFSAFRQAQQFLQEHPLPASAHGRDQQYNRLLSESGTFEEYKNRFDVPEANSSNSNFEYFKQYHETTLLPFARQRQR